MPCRCFTSHTLACRADALHSYSTPCSTAHLPMPLLPHPFVQVFEYVLDHLRARRFADPAPSALPREERVLSLLAR